MVFVPQSVKVDKLNYFSDFTVVDSEYVNMKHKWGFPYEFIQTI